MKKKGLTTVILVQLLSASLVHGQSVAQQSLSSEPNGSLIAYYRGKLTRSMGTGTLFSHIYANDLTKRIDRIHKPSYLAWINTAWATMLMKKGIIREENVHRIAGATLDYWNNPKGKSLGQHGLSQYVGSKYGTRVAGNMEVGRTKQAMRQQLPVRHQLLKQMCLLHDLQQILLEAADEYKTAVMPGYTHLRHAQPTTLGHHLLSIYDPIQRSMEILELGYKAMSLNELGCGALAGTSWPIDRNMVSEYLGCEGLIENSNDAVSYSDGYVLVVSSLTNIMAVLSRLGLELDYWSTLEYDFMDFKIGAVSFMMPQKRSNQGNLCASWYAASKMLANQTEVASMGMKIPHGDMNALALKMVDGTLAALNIIEMYAEPYLYQLAAMEVHEDKMLETARRGYSCASELANEIVRRDGFDYRTAHGIVNSFVIESAQRGIPSREADIDILQAAAQKVVGKKINMSEQQLHEALDPVHFVEVTNSQGGVAPKEVARMIADRRIKLNEARARHLARIEKLEKARTLLISDLERLYRESK